MSDIDEDESFSKQILNMVLENNALREAVFPLVTGYVVFNVVVLIMLIYISVRITLK